MTTTVDTPEAGQGFLARLGAVTVATTAAIQALVLVLGVGLVIGAFVVPEGEAVSKYAAATPADPVRLRLPALGVTAPVVPIGLEGEVLDPPRDFEDVGWWTGSARPGQLSGQTVITGHTVHTGGASMNRLGELSAGQTVDVITHQGTVRYRVTATEVLGRDEVAARAVELFGQDTGDGRLVLVSCADWNGSYYESNIIVFAELLGQVIPKRQRAA